MSSVNNIHAMIENAICVKYAPTQVKAKKEVTGVKQGFNVNFHSGTISGYKVTKNQQEGEEKCPPTYYLNTMELCSVFECSLEDVKNWKKECESAHRHQINTWKKANDGSPEPEFVRFD